jgi:DNA-binding transcriptional ArsR family regulator
MTTTTATTTTAETSEPNSATGKNAVTVQVETRRRQIVDLLQQRLSETEIAQRLKVNKSTVSRDITVLKEQATQFVYSLAKQDLAYFYKNTIDDINKVRTEAWKVYSSCKDQQKREKLLALKVVIASNAEAFNLLQQGPTVMSVKALEERLVELEQAQPPKQEVLTNE